MAINTLGTLKTAAASYLQRSDLTSMLGTFVELATARFSDELRVPEMEKIATTAATSEYTALPTDFRSIILMEADGDVYEYRTPWQLQKLIESNAQPDPPVYTIQDMQFRVWPAPTSTNVDLTYYAALDALVSDSDTNWLLTKRPDVYLMGVLAQARLFLHDDNRFGTAAAFVDKYIAEANRSGRQIRVGSAPISIRVY